MTKLKGVSPETASPSRPKIMIFGPPGVGKTWVSLDFPNVFYIDTEDGANLKHYTDKLKKSGGSYFGVAQGALSFDEVIGQIQALATEKHAYKTVVIDSISKLFSVAIASEAERLGDKNAFGADKKPAIQQMRKMIAWLTRLDMNVIFISHQKSLWGTDSKGQRSEIGVTFDAWEKMEYELHLCLNIFRQGPDYRARVTKSRLAEFEHGSTFEWSYAEFAKRYGKTVIEQEAKQIVLATPEQIANVTRLTETINLPEGQVEKWFKAAGVESWAEMDSDRVEKAIVHITKTYMGSPK